MKLSALAFRKDCLCAPRCLAIGFLLSKARPHGQFPLARLSAPRGPLHWAWTCFCFRGRGERGVNPHLFSGLLHLLKSPACFFFSRNMPRGKVHPWRIANMRGIDGEQKFRLCWFGNLSLALHIRRPEFVTKSAADEENALRRAGARIKPLHCAPSRSRPRGAAPARRRSARESEPQSPSKRRSDFG